jgi:hypothetical protein
MTKIFFHIFLITVTFWPITRFQLIVHFWDTLYNNIWDTLYNDTDAFELTWNEMFQVRLKALPARRRRLKMCRRSKFWVVFTTPSGIKRDALMYIKMSLFLLTFTLVVHRSNSFQQLVQVQTGFCWYSYYIHMFFQVLKILPPLWEVYFVDDYAALALGQLGVVLIDLIR